MNKSIYNYYEVGEFLLELEKWQSLANGDLNYYVENGKIMHT